MTGERSDSSSGETSLPVLAEMAEAETVALGPNTVRFLLSGDETGGKLSITLFTIAPPPAPAPPPHRHQDADESIYVVDGTLDCTLDERSGRLTAGGIMHVPRGTMHGLSNPGPGPTTILVVLNPPGFEGYWRDAARLLSESEGVPSQQAMLALQRTHHMETGGKERNFG